ncbi:MAG: RNB domain-containing ribonuclease, partial [Bacteroidia bacterium]|nr:RNB domain-containing ribonuclease [Bacteroidia bacterium]
VHDIPSQEKLADFANFAKRFGHKFEAGGDRQAAHNLNKLMAKISGTTEENVLQQLAIRSMAKAVYTTENIGHYGLAFDHYTHFTSPIRRYPDMIVHRLLQKYLDGKNSANANEIERQCKHSTEMEIRASEAERSSTKYKQAEYLMGHLGEVFSGIISGVTEWGIFVELEESKCEGLVRLRNIPGDFYEFDQRNFCIVGHRTKRRYQLGDKLEVMLAGVDLVKKQIDFELVDDNAPDVKENRRKRRKSEKKEKQKDKRSKKSNRKDRRA